MSEKVMYQDSETYLRIEKAIRFVEKTHQAQPTLDEMAKSVHMSKYHFNRLFKRWAGVTPLQFLQHLTLAYTKRKLVESSTVLEASLDAGLSGPGRLHDLFVNFEAVTPGEYKQMGAGLKISYGFAQSPFGECLLARTDRGICHLGFVRGENRSDALADLLSAWPKAAFSEDENAAGIIVRQIFSLNRADLSKPFHLHLKGTNFQVQVWRALLSIPTGSIASYQNVADLLGKPKAFRAVANAIAINPVAYLIPCHRVISKSGEIHRYRWGAVRKKAMIGFEAAAVG